MRNIEEIAAEEDARIWEERRLQVQGFLLVSGAALGIWGWWIFSAGRIEKGAFFVLVSLLFLSLAWGILKAIKPSYYAFAAGALGALPLLVLYSATRAPCFGWGKDPAFWLSVHAGAVEEPAWSPLSYLFGEAACFLFPQDQFSFLPELSALVLSFALFFMMQEYFAQLKNKNLVTLGLALLVCWALGASYPFWNAGTLGLGLVSSLGLLLFLFQKTLLASDEKPWQALTLLLGLLWCVHPLWGFLGSLNQIGFLDWEGKKIKRNLFPLFVGFTPCLWIVFRADRFFPSWGGDHPFKELFRNWQDLLEKHFAQDWQLGASIRWTGSVFGVCVGLSFFLWVINFFKGKTTSKPLITTFEFWIWAVSGMGGILFFSNSSQMLGPSGLWFGAGLGGVLLKLLERAMEKRQAGFVTGTRLASLSAAVILMALVVVWLPGDRFLRRQLYFPEQHAFNLIRALGLKSILIFNDPFEAAACRETQLMEPVAPTAILLDSEYLNKRWYIAECVNRVPDLLFSGLAGSSDDQLKSLVTNNRNRWEIHWALSAIPSDWKEPKAFSTVLTQEFEGGIPREDPVDAQYRYDLTVLPQDGEKLDIPLSYYLSRYVIGFNEMGKALMNEGRYLTAIHAFERSVKLDPSYSEPQSYLAQIYSRQNILEAARLEFEKTIKTHPGKISELMKGIDLAQKTKDDVKTVGLLDEMIRLNTELADAQYQLSKILEKEGRSPEAKSLLESSLQLNPRHMEAQMTLGHLMVQLGNRIKAEDAFRSVLGLDSQNKEAQVELWKLLNKP